MILVAVASCPKGSRGRREPAARRDGSGWQVPFDRLRGARRAVSRRTPGHRDSGARPPITATVGRLAARGVRRAASSSGCSAASRRCSSWRSWLLAGRGDRSAGAGGERDPAARGQQGGGGVGPAVPQRRAPAVECRLPKIAEHDEQLDAGVPRHAVGLPGRRVGPAVRQGEVTGFTAPQRVFWSRRAAARAGPIRRPAPPRSTARSTTRCTSGSPTSWTRRAASRSRTTRCTHG